MSKTAKGKQTSRKPPTRAPSTHSRTASSKSSSTHATSTSRHSQAAPSRQPCRRSRFRFIQLLLPFAMLLGGAAMFFVAEYVSGDSQQQVLEQLQAFSNRDSGATLEEVITTIQQDPPPYEVIFIFDAEGQKLIEYTSENPYGVSLPEEASALLQPLRGLTQAHNHPLADVGPSDNDLGMPIRTGLGKSIDTLVVIGSRHVYYLANNHKAWPSDEQFYNYVERLYWQSGPLVPAQLMGSIMIDGKEQVYFTTQFFQTFAEHYGYTFWVEPDDGLWEENDGLG